VTELMSEEIRTPELRIDSDILLNELTSRFIKILKEFAPFGPGNMRPIFRVQNAELVGTPRIVGKNHLRFKVRQEQQVFDAIGFGLGSLLDFLRTNGKALDLVFSVDEHEWLGQNANHAEAFPQLKIKDIKKHTEGT
jgi:single-stranded-DNA-specific exonuclease